MATDNNSNNPANSGLGDPDDMPDGDVDIAEDLAAAGTAELARASQVVVDLMNAREPPLGATQGNESSDFLAKVMNAGEDGKDLNAILDRQQKERAGPPIVGNLVSPPSFFDQLKSNIEAYIQDGQDKDVTSASIYSYAEKELANNDDVEKPAGMAVSDRLDNLVLAKEAFASQPRPLTQAEAARDISLTDLTVAAEAVKQQSLSSNLEKILYIDSVNGRDGLNITKNPLPGIGLKKLIRYGEGEDGSFPTFVLDQIVYIQGVDISKYLKGSVTISKNNASGHNTLTFTLSNAHDQFVWAERNLAGPVFGRSYYYDEHGEKQEYPAAEVLLTFGQQVNTPDNGSAEEVAILKRALNSTGTKAFLPYESIKKKVFDYKGNPSINPISVDANNNKVFPRFDLVPNKCIFARMDPIRVWSLYPFRPRGQNIPASQELWMPEFTGFIEHVSVEDDNVLGTSTITIECSDIRQSVIQKMRISSSFSSSLANPLDDIGFRPLRWYDDEKSGVASGLSNQTQRNQTQSQLLDDARFFSPDRNNNAIFYDDIINSPFGTPIPPNEDIVEALKTLLVFKKDKLIRGRARVGVNNIEFGGTFTYQPSDKEGYLEQYHTFCLFGPKRRPWTLSEVEAVGKETTSTGKFWPLNARLWFLIPATGTGPKNLADLGMVQIQLVHQIDWTTRMEAIRNIVESLDYQMYVSGTGDIHIEFPMADFRPEDFGEYKQVFRFNKSLISTSYSDEAEDPVTGIIVETGFAINSPTVKNDPTSVVKTRLQLAFAYAPYIAGRYGINISQPIPLPFLRYGQLAIAQQRAIIELQKANARCNTLQFQSSFRPFLLPNRPAHNVRRSRMGVIVSVETTFEIGAQPKASTSVGLEHVRTWTGGYFSEVSPPPKGGVQSEELVSRDTNPIQPHGTSLEDNQVEDQVFTTVMGGVNTPTSNKALWGSDSLLVANSGIHVLNLNKPPKAEPENVVPAPVHEDASELGDTQVAVETPTVENTKKFASNPLALNNVRSPFGPRNTPRDDGTVSTFHQGVDFDTQIVKPSNPSSPTEVYAVHDGTAVANRYDVSIGYTITLSAKNGLTAKYWHLAPDRIDPSKKGEPGYQAAVEKAKLRGRNDAQQKYNVSIGDNTNGTAPTFGSLSDPFYMKDGVPYPVKAGDLIGFASNTGTAVASSNKNPNIGAGTHLHFVVMDKGKSVDPVPYLPGPITGRKEAKK